MQAELSEFLAGRGRARIVHAPGPLALKSAASIAMKAGRPAILVLRDEPAMARAEAALAFFAPQLPLYSLPAWDCLPYDRVSPQGDLVARRLATLTQLAHGLTGPALVLAPVNAVLQRLPERRLFREGALWLKPGGRAAVEMLQRFFSENGYRRAGTVREAGEFALRGGIVDVFAPGTAEPVRLDLFGDEIEKIRTFDAMTQRTTGELSELAMLPVSEVMLGEAAIARFRAGYRELFGAQTQDDPLYEAISEGRGYPGMEHWLPLFHERLETLFDYLPKDAPLILDAEIEQAVTARFETVRDYYEARRELWQAPGRRTAGDGAAIYKPVPAGRLYLDAADWESLAVLRPVLALTQFDAPETLGEFRFNAGGRPVRSFSEIRANPDADLYGEAERYLATHPAPVKILAAATPGSRARLRTLLEEHDFPGLIDIDTAADGAALKPGQIGLAALDLGSGAVDADMVLLTEEDLLGERLARPPRRRRKAENFIAEASSLELGDLVVHMDHGVGRYDGLETVKVEHAPHDCLRVLYAGGDKLYVPVENIDVLSRYGSEDSEHPLDRLGGVAWQARKARAKERVRAIAFQLLKIAAQRALREGEAVSAPEGSYDEFVARFAFAETDDQLRAIEDVMGDMASGKPMDRLICGDVGFGKTEIALRAAFIAAMNGMQVAVVAPTTILARQHYRTFQKRFEGLPIRVEQLSRFVSTKDANLVKLGIDEGKVDIVVGTHSLLQKGVRFQRLGLLIVDEEQHFGVKQKERMKELRADVHVLTLTATPIPRTLQMALSGVREMSIIATPPVDRLAVRTFVTPYDPVVLREAIQRERFRGGQIYYVCPRVSDLAQVSEQVRNLIPEMKIAVAHGQMGANELEEVMNDFIDGRIEMLISTNIVESGLDIPSANTMIVHRADMFGLSQLYQLRGRIGRAKQRAYCYLTLPTDKPISASAAKRLEVMQTLDSLGAGFTLASHDMDIRGAGNLLGEEQSGHIREVGVELYQRMLEEAVADARAGRIGAKAGLDQLPETEEAWSPTLNLGAPVLIPDHYVADLSVRLGLYRRLSGLTTKREIDAFAVELADRFGQPPKEVDTLLAVMTIKLLCRRAHVDKVDAGPNGAVISFRDNSFPAPEKLIFWLQQQAGAAKLRANDQKLVVMRPWDSAERRVKGVTRVMADLARLTEKKAAA